MEFVHYLVQKGLYFLSYFSLGCVVSYVSSPYHSLNQVSTTYNSLECEIQMSPCNVSKSDIDIVMDK